MSLQQEITGFLDSGSTPAPNQQANQSKKSKAKSRATRGGRKDTGTPQDPPERTQLKRKRITKEERKRQRKRVNQPRKCKATNRNTDSTPTQTSVTPMPSPTQEGSPDLQSSGHVTDTNIHINDRSLTDMLMSGVASDSVESAASCTLDADRLQSKLTAAALALEHEVTEKTRLHNTVELLQIEIEEYKRNQKVMKSEIKRLTTDNDNLRRTLSRYRGMRRYTTSDNHDKSTSTHDESSIPDANDDLATTQVKLDSLRDFITHAGEMLLSAVRDECTPSNDNFVEVTSRRSRRLRNVQRPNDSPDTPDTHDSHPASTSTEAQSISVVIGAGRAPLSNEPLPSGYAAACRRAPTSSLPSTAVYDRSNSQQSTTRTGHSGPRSHQLNPGAGQQRPEQRLPATREAAHRPQSHPVVSSRGPSTLVIGTSLVRGLGVKLTNLGANATVCSYPGQDIPYIRSRIPYLVSRRNPPEQVVLQCGGNDCEQTEASYVTSQYECLISEIQQYCPNVHIILSTIPPRGNNAMVLKNIDSVNTWLNYRTRRGDNVRTVKVCPQLTTSFKKDMVHFNGKGLAYYAKRLVGHIQNFHRPSERRDW